MRTDDAVIGDRGRDISYLVPPHRAGRALIEAHPVLISDEWRRSERQERGGERAVEEAIAEPKRGCASRRAGVFTSVGEEYATSEPASSQLDV
jgi:hypothetical protein